MKELRLGDRLVWGSDEVEGTVIARNQYVGIHILWDDGQHDVYAFKTPNRLRKVDSEDG